MQFITFEKEGKSITTGFYSIRIDYHRDFFVSYYEPTLVLEGVSKYLAEEIIDFIYYPVKVILKIKNETITQEFRIVDLSYNNDSKELFIGINDPIMNELKFNFLEENDVTQKEESEDYCPCCGNSY